MKTPKTRREREIWQVCDELLAEGIEGSRITGDSIRERLFALGFSKGSPNEIYKYRKNWREARGILEEDYSFPMQMQTIFTDPIARAVESVRSEIRNEAHLEIEKNRKEAQEQLNIFQSRTYEMEQDLKNMLEKNQEMLLEISEYKSNIHQLQIALSEERQQKAALEQRVLSTNEAYSKLERETNHILNELKQSHLDAQENLKKQLKIEEMNYRKEVEELKNILSLQQQRMSADIDKLKTLNQETDIRLGKVQSQFELECQKSQEFSAMVRMLESKVEALKQERRNHLDKIKDLELKQIANETELRQINNQYNVMQTLNLELQHNFEGKLAHIAKLEERNRQLQAIIKEKYFTVQQ